MDERGGRPSEGGAPWGYRDLTIPLNVREGLTDRRTFQARLSGKHAQHAAGSNGARRAGRHFAAWSRPQP